MVTMTSYCSQGFS